MVVRMCLHFFLKLPVVSFKHLTIASFRFLIIKNIEKKHTVLGILIE